MNERVRLSTFGGRISPTARDSGKESLIAKKNFGKELTSFADYPKARSDAKEYELVSSDSELSSMEAGAEKKRKHKHKHKHSSSKHRAREKAHAIEKGQSRRGRALPAPPPPPQAKMSLAELWGGGAHKQHEYQMWVDRAGDSANLDYGHPFKLDVPSYRVARRVFPQFPAGPRARTATVAPTGLWLTEREAAAAAQRARTASWRYLRSANLAALQDRRARRINMSRAGASGPGEVRAWAAADVLPVPLAVQSQTAAMAVAADAAGAEEGESVEEALGRKTREFNAATRLRPRDAGGWLAFAAFQDEFARLQGRRSLQQPAALVEKKAAILLRGLQHCPADRRLLVAYLDAARSLMDPPRLRGLWEAAVARHGGDVLLWQARRGRRAARRWGHENDRGRWWWGGGII